MAKKGWGKTGAAGLQEGDYIFQFVEFGNKDSKGRPQFLEFEESQYEDVPTPRLVFRLIILDGPVRVGETISPSQRWKGIDVQDGEIVFLAKGQNPSGLIRWLTAFGMRFPTEDDPGDTVLADPPDPNDPTSIIMTLEKILQIRRNDGCLAQGHVGKNGRIVWDSMVPVAEKLAKMLLEKEPMPAKDEAEELRNEARNLMKTLQVAGAWSIAEGRAYCEKEYGSKFTKDLSLGQLRDLIAYMHELAEEKGLELAEEF